MDLSAYAELSPGKVRPSNINGLSQSEVGAVATQLKLTMGELSINVLLITLIACTTK